MRYLKDLLSIRLVPFILEAVEGSLKLKYEYHTQIQFYIYMLTKLQSYIATYPSVRDKILFCIVDVLVITYCSTPRVALIRTMGAANCKMRSQYERDHTSTSLSHTANTRCPKRVNPDTELSCLSTVKKVDNIFLSFKLNRREKFHRINKQILEYSWKVILSMVGTWWNFSKYSPVLLFLYEINLILE